MSDLYAMTIDGLRSLVLIALIVLMLAMAEWLWRNRRL